MLDCLIHDAGRNCGGRIRILRRFALGKTMNYRRDLVDLFRTETLQLRNDLFDGGHISTLRRATLEIHSVGSVELDLPPSGPVAAPDRMLASVANIVHYLMIVPIGSPIDIRIMFPAVFRLKTMMGNWLSRHIAIEVASITASRCESTSE